MKHGAETRYKIEHTVQSSFEKEPIIGPLVNAWDVAINVLRVRQVPAQQIECVLDALSSAKDWLRTWEVLAQLPSPFANRILESIEGLAQLTESLQEDDTDDLVSWLMGQPGQLRLRSRAWLSQIEEIEPRAHMNRPNEPHMHYDIPFIVEPHEGWVA